MIDGTRRLRTLWAGMLAAASAAGPARAGEGALETDELPLGIIKLTDMAPLEAGTIHGYCVGEPRSQQAVLKGIGVPVFTDYEIWKNNPERVFGVTAECTEASPNPHRALIRALNRAGGERTILLVKYDVDEAILLTDGVVMMTNGPRARVGHVMNVDLPRLRSRKALLEHPDYDRYRETLLELLAGCEREAAGGHESDAGAEAA